jgi:CheY-like chemotaxis protein
MQNKINRVMLIDDNIIDLKINEKLIRLANIANEITVCTSGDEALNYLKKNLATDINLPNLILLDIQMPEMDGFEFMEYYKNLPTAITNHCTVAMLSSTLDFGDIQKAQANPLVIKLLKKPLVIEDLKQLF